MCRVQGMGCARGVRPGISRVLGTGLHVSRVAIVLIVLGMSLVAPSMAAAARSEFFGIAQGPTLDGQDLRGMAAARVRTNRFVLAWGWLQPAQGPPRLGPGGPVHRPACLARNPGRPGSLGKPGLGGRLGLDSPARSGRRPSRRGETSSRRSWRATGRTAATGRPGTGNRYGADANPLPIQSWQIWNEPNLQELLRAVSIAGQVRPAASDLPRRDPRAGIRRPGSCSPECPATGT